jgi:hypothetical protein
MHTMTMTHTNVAPAFVFLMILAIGLIAVVVSIIKALIFCKIFSKTGYHWALGLLMLLPIADLIMVLILAFGNWPIRRELETLRMRVRE